MGQGTEPSCSITTTMSSHPSLWNCGTPPHLKGSSGMANSSHEALLTTRESSSRGWLPSMRCEQCMENCPFRLAPGQDPEQMVRQLRAHLDAQGFQDIELLAHPG